MIAMGSLFDGIGGFPLAGQRYGIKTLWASEIEPFPIAVTKIRFPDMTHVGDITKLKGANLPPVNIVCGGSPCQDLSVANGERRGIAGARSGLFFEQIRVIKELRDADKRRGRADESVRPRYMVWENVPGAFSSGSPHGEDFRVVLEEICGIATSGSSVPRPPGGRWESAGAIMGEEFSVAWRVVDAQHWFVPQRRKRIVAVADFAGHSAPQILFEQDRLLGHFTPREEAGQDAPADTGTGSEDAGRSAVRTPPADENKDFERGPGTLKSSVISFACNQRDEIRDLHDVSAAVCAHPSVKQQTFVAENMGSLTPWDTQQARIFTADSIAPTVAGADGGGGRHPAGLLLEKESLTAWDVQSRRIHDENGVWPALYGGEGGGHGYVAAFSHKAGAKASGIGYEKERSPTLTSNTPSVLCLMDQGGQRMDVSEDQAGTLRAQMDGHPPLVMATQQGGAETCEDLCPTITSAAGSSGNNQPILLFGNHGKDSRYTGPHDVVSTISAYWGNGRNNCDLALNPQEAETYAIAGNIIGRKTKNGGNGLGVQNGICPTITSTDKHAIFSQQRSDEYMENDVVSTQAARQYKDATDLVCDAAVFGQHQYGGYREGCATLRAEGGDNGGGSENLVAVCKNLIRRLLPIECERLMHFPDKWTDIPGASDSKRYKALGNSVVTSCMEYVLRGIVYFLSQEKDGDI